jgi:hypothetical protein
VHGDQRDDQLRCVPEGRVEEAADPGAGALRGVLRGLPDQPGERDQRHRREHELRRRAEIRRVVEHDRERPHEQAEEEGAPDHEREP